jgi:hypothetical protein
MMNRLFNLDLSFLPNVETVLFWSFILVTGMGVAQLSSWLSHWLIEREMRQDPDAPDEADELDEADDPDELDDPEKLDETG